MTTYYRAGHIKVLQKGPSVSLLQSSLNIIETAAQTLQHLGSISHTTLCTITWENSNPTNWLQIHLSMCLPGPSLDTHTWTRLDSAVQYTCMLHSPLSYHEKITFKEGSCWMLPWYLLPRKNDCGGQSYLPKPKWSQLAQQLHYPDKRGWGRKGIVVLVNKTHCFRVGWLQHPLPRLSEHPLNEP